MAAVQDRRKIILFIERIHLRRFLSFAPDAEPFDLQKLNVLIGPNGSGKSNIIEAFELLKAMPVNFEDALRYGGGVKEWVWKGKDFQNHSDYVDICIETAKVSRLYPALRHEIEFVAARNKALIISESVEIPAAHRPQGYLPLYDMRRGNAIIQAKSKNRMRREERRFKSEDLSSEESILSQLKEPQLYPEITRLGRQYEQIQTFREWEFGRRASLRQPQQTDLPDDRLLESSKNLALALNQIEHRGSGRFDELMKRFFPRYQRMSTRVSGGSIQFHVHEKDFSSPISAARLSDGTLRFMAILAILLSPEPPPLVCIDEPELGMHPDAVLLIAELLVEASDRMQLIVTTHSEALVAALSSQPEAVVTCERIKGGTQLRRLDPKKLAKSLEDRSLGGLWRMGKIGANP
ncbi:MAG: AAA family ATPase [Rhodospirillales bacterium]